ncbi:MAG: hypothetical protein VB131_09210, partial [Burkholderia gladioli]
KVVSITSKMMDTTLASIFAGVYDGHAESLTLQQTVLGLVDEGVGVALVPESMRRAQWADVVFRPLVDAPTIEQALVWSPANRNPCLARFLGLPEAHRSAAPARAVPERWTIKPSAGVAAGRGFYHAQPRAKPQAFGASG